LRREDLVRLCDMDTRSAGALTADFVFAMVMRCAALLVVIGGADYAYERWEFERSLRMSRQEIVDELRQEEGDPQMRARRKALRRNLLQQGITRQTREAAVVVTNPTHLAVALLYQPGMPAPKVVAKGRYLMAQRILAIARKWGIPVIQNVETARALYKTAGLGDYVPSPLYRAVAEILAVIHRRRQRLAR